MSAYVSNEFTCKCGRKGWITEDKQLSPCPNCKRIYFGVYNPDTYHIEGKDITNDPTYVTHSNIDKDELKTFMDNIGSSVIKEVEEKYNREPL